MNLSRVNAVHRMLILLLCGSTGLCLAGGAAADDAIHVRVASYNVEFSRSATPEQIGAMFKPYALDVIGFNEAPNGDWTARVGAVLGMNYCYVGAISSANHVNKYKSILSRTPLEGARECRLEAKTGWNPGSAVMATTTIRGLPVTLVSIHLCKSQNGDGHARALVASVLSKAIGQRLLVVGDFNNTLGDPDMLVLAKVGLTSTWDDLKMDVSSLYTWNALDPKQREGVIDHILHDGASGGHAVAGGIIELKKPLSDHKPVWAEMVYPR